MAKPRPTRTATNRLCRTKTNATGKCCSKIKIRMDFKKLTMSKIDLTNDGKLYQIKRSIHAKVVCKEYTKIIHIYASFQIWEYLDKKGQVINQIVKIHNFSLNQQSLYLKNLISELHCLDDQCNKP